MNSTLFSWVPVFASGLNLIVNSVSECASTSIQFAELDPPDFPVYLIYPDGVISKLNEREVPVVFVLWGSYARSKKALITNPKHLIIESVHPSPLSAHRGFFGSKPFSKTNSLLKEFGLKEIEWKIESK